MEEMFDSIAPAYDFMNRAMTLGIDRWWRRVAVKMVGKSQPRRILDVATGTGDFAIGLYNKIHPQQVVGIDLSQGMLDVARTKVVKHGLQDAITLQQGDCLALPFNDGDFDAVTVAFGVRNSSICCKAMSRCTACWHLAECCAWWSYQRLATVWCAGSMTSTRFI